VDGLDDSTNAFFVLVSDVVPRLEYSDPVFDIKQPLPAKFTISVIDTELAHGSIK